MKDFSGVNLCIWIEILSIIKKLVSLPFVLLYLVFWYLSAMIVFLTREQMVLQMDLWRMIWN